MGIIIMWPGKKAEMLKRALYLLARWFSLDGNIASRAFNFVLGVNAYNHECHVSFVNFVSIKSGRPLSTATFLGTKRNGSKTLGGTHD